MSIVLVYRVVIISSSSGIDLVCVSCRRQWLRGRGRGSCTLNWDHAQFSDDGDVSKLVAFISSLSVAGGTE